MGEVTASGMGRRHAEHGAVENNSSAAGEAAADSRGHNSVGLRERRLLMLMYMM